MQAPPRSPKCARKFSTQIVRCACAIAGARVERVYFGPNPFFRTELGFELNGGEQEDELAVQVAANAIFLVNPKRIDIRIEPAFGLSQMQTDGRGLPAVGEQLTDVFHVGARPVLFRKLFQGNERSRESLGDDPFVVAGNSFSRHQRTPRVWRPTLYPDPARAAIAHLWPDKGELFCPTPRR